MNLSERDLQNLIRSIDNDNAVMASMDPTKRKIYESFLDEKLNRQTMFPGFSDLSMEDQEAWSKSIDEELYNIIPGAKEAHDEYIAQAKLMDAVTKGRVS